MSKPSVKGSLRSCMIAGSLFLFVFLSSCASPSGISTHVYNLASQKDYARARLFLEKNKANYGKNNILLYYLDKGMVLHLAGEHKESSLAFEQAKAEYERLYTKSASGIIASWLLNEYTAPYSGEDFERVLINVLLS